MLPIPIPDMMLDDQVDVIARSQRTVAGKIQQDPEYTVAFGVPAGVFTLASQRLLTILGKTSLDAPICIMRAVSAVETNWKIRQQTTGQEWYIDQIRHWPNRASAEILILELRERA